MSLQSILKAILFYRAVQKSKGKSAKEIPQRECQLTSHSLLYKLGPNIAKICSTSQLKISSDRIRLLKKKEPRKMQIHRGYYSNPSFPYASVVVVLLCMWKARIGLIANDYNTKHNLFLSQGLGSESFPEWWKTWLQDDSTFANA